MKELNGIIQSATEIAQAHKATVAAMFAGVLSSISNVLELIPASPVARLTALMTFVVLTCLAFYHRANTEKVRREAYKIELESKLLELQIQREQAEIEQKRRRDDK